MSMRRRSWIGALHFILAFIRLFVPGIKTSRFSSYIYVGCGPVSLLRSNVVLRHSRLLLTVLFVTLTLLNATKMEAFLRPASNFPPLLQALQKGPLKVCTSASCVYLLDKAFALHSLRGVGLHCLPEFR